MSDSSQAIDFVIKNEGGLTIDDGGHTNFGITQHYLDVRGIDKKVENLTKDDAIELYTALFKNCGCDLIGNDQLSTRFFDTCVNSGSSQAVKILQFAYNKYSGKEELVPDGVLGPLTLSAINGATDQTRLLNVFRGRRLDFYNSLIHSNPEKYAKYAKDWIARAQL